MPPNKLFSRADTVKGKLWKEFAIECPRQKKSPGGTNILGLGSSSQVKLSVTF